MAELGNWGRHFLLITYMYAEIINIGPDVPQFGWKEQ